MMSELLGRDGHLLDLAIERYLSGELEPDARAELEAHVASSAVDRERLEAARAVVAMFEALPVPDLSVMPEPANRPWSRMLGLVAAAAAVASVGLWAGSASDSEGLGGSRLKGTGLTLEVFVAGEPPRQLASGAEVLPGDKLGFRVRAAQDGHLLVLGLDEAGSVYPCLPARPGDAVAHARSDAAVDVQAAVVLDAVLGTEQLVAVHCETPQAWSAVAAAVRAGLDATPLLEGCTHDVVRLQKVRVRGTP
jgi:anti-sigma factor RsiW